MPRLEQPCIVAALCFELSRQGVKFTVPEQTRVLILAADMVVAAFEDGEPTEGETPCPATNVPTSTEE